MRKYGVYELGDVGRGAHAAHRLVSDRLIAWAIALDYGPGFVVCSLPSAYSSVRDELAAKGETQPYRDGHGYGLQPHCKLPKLDGRTVYGREYRRGFEDARIAVMIHAKRKAAS